MDRLSAEKLADVSGLNEIPLQTHIVFIFDGLDDS